MGGGDPPEVPEVVERADRGDPAGGAEDSTVTLVGSSSLRVLSADTAESSTEGTEVSNASVVFERGTRCGF